MKRRQTEFARVYEEHVFSVYGFVAYRLRDRDAAEDLTQATFERALQAWSRFDPRRASERTWLLTIARNLLIDEHRKHQSERLEPLEETHVATVPGPEHRLEGSSELVNALWRLSGRDREVLALRYGGDLSGPETAEMLGLTLANVQQIASRSLRKLRELLEDDYSVPTASRAPRAVSSHPSTK